MAVVPADRVVPVALEDRAAQVDREEVAVEAAEEVAPVEGTPGVSSPQTQQLDWDETSPGETRGFLFGGHPTVLWFRVGRHPAKWNRSRLFASHGDAESRWRGRLLRHFVLLVAR